MADTAPLLLMSMPQMADPNFARTVILLCNYTAEHGAFGLVVNRQMDELACQIVRTDPPVRVDPSLRLWVGGPVDPQRTWALTADPVAAPVPETAIDPERQEPAPEETQEICPGVHLSVSPALMLRMLQEPPSSRARIIAGYSGWQPGQLEEEIAASAWLTLDVEPALIFDVPPERMWEESIRRLGADPASLQTSFGVH